MQVVVVAAIEVRHVEEARLQLPVVGTVPAKVHAVVGGYAGHETVPLHMLPLALLPKRTQPPAGATDESQSMTGTLQDFRDGLVPFPGRLAEAEVFSVAPSHNVKVRPPLVS